MTSLSSDTNLSRNSFRNQSFGKVIDWHPSSDGLQGRSAFAYFKLSVYSEGIIRVQASRFSSFESNPYSVIVEPKNTPFEIEDFGKQVELTTSLLRVRLHLDAFSLSFFDSQGKLLNQDDSLGICWLGTEVSSYKKIQKNEKFLGLGEKTGDLNRAGKAYTHWNKDYFGYGVNDDPLYMSIPFYLGVHDKGCYGIFFDNTHKTLVNLYGLLFFPPTYARKNYFRLYLAYGSHANAPQMVPRLSAMSLFLLSRIGSTCRSQYI